MSITQSFPPGPKGLPFIGNLLDFQQHPLRFYREFQRNYGAMTTIHIGKRPVLFVFRPEHIRYYLAENSRNFTKPTIATGKGIKLFLGDGLLTIDGDMHRQQRRLVQPAFHKHRVESYAHTMTQFTQEMLDHWQPGTVVNIASEMQQLALRITTKTLFNVDSLEETARLGQAFNTVIRNTPRRSPILGRFGSQRLSPKLIDGLRVIDTFVYDLIAQRRKENKDTGDLLSMLLTAQEEDAVLTDKQVHDHVLTFVAAGQDNVQNTLSWTFYLLSKNPLVLEKLLAELHTVLAGRAPTLSDLPNLPYLDWVINESWRFYPPAWRQVRQALSDFELDGYHIPTGTITILSQWVLHNLPDVWGDPAHFRPERWDPASKQKIPQGAYFPFGLGPHICIGMPLAQLETKLLLATILQRYTPHLISDAQVVPLPVITLRPKDGILMRLEPTTVPLEVSS